MAKHFLSVPSMPLPRAVDRLSGVVATVGPQAALTRSGWAQALGYASPSVGRFAALVTSLMQYGLLERVSQKLVVSQLARDIMFASDPAVQAAALQTAVLRPTIFKSIYQAHQGDFLPADLRKYVLYSFADQLTSAQAASVAACVPESFVHAGILQGGRVVAVDDNTTPIAKEPVLPTVPHTPAEPVQNHLTDHTVLRKDLGAGRQVVITVPVDLSQDERDNLMALIQYL